MHQLVTNIFGLFGRVLTLVSGKSQKWERQKVEGSVSRILMLEKKSGKITNFMFHFGNYTTVRFDSCHCCSFIRIQFSKNSS
jgi:hypothetical protein